MTGTRVEKINLIEHLSNFKNYRERFCAYRNLWEMAANAKVLPDFPLHLDIELSGVCNLKCPNCFQNYIDRPLGLIDTHLFRKIIDEGVSCGLCSVKFQVRGESFIHPDLFRYIRYAKDAGVMDTQVTTNGTFMNDDSFDQIFESGLDGLIFSFDAHHAEGAGGSEKNNINKGVQDNIQKLLTIKRSQALRKPWVRIQASLPDFDEFTYVSTRRIIEDIFPDADAILVKPLHNFCDEEDSYPDLQDNYTFLPCSHLFQRLAVFWNGEVTVCCADYNNRFNLGKANSLPIRDIWLGGKIESLRDMHLNGRRKDVPVCSHCHMSTKTVKFQARQQIHPFSNTSF